MMPALRKIQRDDSAIVQRPTTLNILLVEDSRLVADRLRELLSQIPEMELIATVDNQQQAVDMIHDHAVDVVILDLKLARGTGFDVLRKITGLAKCPVSIIFTNYDLPQYRREAALLGVHYFLDKSRDYDRLPDVLHEIARSRA